MRETLPKNRVTSLRTYRERKISSTCEESSLEDDKTVRPTSRFCKCPDSAAAVAIVLSPKGKANAQRKEKGPLLHTRINTLKGLLCKEGNVNVCITCWK